MQRKIIMMLPQSDYITQNSDDEARPIPQRAEELGCDSDVEIAFVPSNFYTADSKEELAYHDEVLTVQKLTQQEGIDIDQFISYSEADTLQLNSTEIFLGSVYVTLEFIQDNWGELVTLIKLVQKHYSRTRIGGTAEITLSVEKREEKIEKFDYEGPVDELETVVEDLKELQDDD